jgi:hypothetical protein
MKVLKWNDFFKVSENVFNDIPREIIDSALRKLKKELENLFNSSEFDTTPSVVSPGEEGFTDKVVSDNPEELSFKDLGLALIRCHINSYTKTNRNMDVRFTDSEGNMYSLYIRIDIESGISNKKDKELEPNMIQKAFIKFKKYDLDGELYNSVSKNINDIWEITKDEKFIVELKLEVDGDAENDELFIELE